MITPNLPLSINPKIRIFQPLNLQSRIPNLPLSTNPKIEISQPLKSTATHCNNPTQPQSLPERGWDDKARATRYEEARGSVARRVAVEVRRDGGEA